jgi:hypothetical protein
MNKITKEALGLYNKGHYDVAYHLLAQFLLDQIEKEEVYKCNQVFEDLIAEDAPKILGAWCLKVTYYRKEQLIRWKALYEHVITCKMSENFLKDLTESLMSV